MHAGRRIVLCALAATAAGRPLSAQVIYGSDRGGNVTIVWGHGSPTNGLYLHRWRFVSTLAAPVRLCFNYSRVGESPPGEVEATIPPGEKRDGGFWTYTRSASDPIVSNVRDCGVTANPGRGGSGNQIANSRPIPVPTPVPMAANAGAAAGEDALQRELDRQLQQLRQPRASAGGSAAPGAAIGQGLSTLQAALSAKYERDRANAQAAQARLDRYEDELQRRSDDGGVLYQRTIDTMADPVAEDDSAANRALAFLESHHVVPARPLGLPGSSGDTQRAYADAHKGCAAAGDWSMFDCVLAGDLLLAAGRRADGEQYYGSACYMDRGTGCAQLIRSVAARKDYVLARALVRNAGACNGAEAPACLALYRALWTSRQSAERIQPMPPTGLPAPYEFLARHAGRSWNVVLGNTSYGPDVVMNAPPYTPALNAVEYDINLTEGLVYRLQGLVAAAEARPVRVSVNGRLVTENAFTGTTASWNETAAQWMDGGEITLNAGRNILRLERHPFFPHLVRIRLTAIRRSR